MSKTEAKTTNYNGPTLGGYHEANFRRRTRCVIVFAVMIAAFAVTIVVNINSGNVHIGIGDIARAHFPA